MAFKSIRVSDVSGEELPDAGVVNVVVRSHPALKEAVQFDASEVELKPLKPLSNLVQLEYRFANGNTQDVYVSASDFAKMIPDAKLKGFDPLRGRRRGFTPKS